MLERLLERAVQWAFGIAAIVCWVLAAAVIFTQVVQWLKLAEWHPVTIADAWEAFGFKYPAPSNWAGVQRIIDALFNWPASLGYFLLGLIFMWCLFVINKEIEKEASNRKFSSMMKEFERLDSDNNGTIKE